jgi:hypothetical protein
MLLKNKFDPFANRFTFESENIRVKGFLNDNVNLFENDINDFFINSNLQILDLKYHKNDRIHTAMIMYNKNHNSLNKNAYISRELRVIVNSQPDFEIFMEDMNKYLSSNKLKIIDIQHSYSTSFSSLILYNI